MYETLQMMADAWKLMVGRLPAAQIVEGEGVVSTLGNVPLMFLNVSLLSRPAADAGSLRQLLDTAAAHAAQSSHPAGVIARTDWMPTGWEAVAAGCGLVPALPLTGMEAEALTGPGRPAPPLEIRRLANEAGARDLASLNAQAYGMPVELFESAATMHLWQPDSLGYVGYHDGQPVSCAAALPVAGTVYIALVATLPGQQGKGYADAVMRHTITEARQAMGVPRVTLHATDMGRPVYQAMGFAVGPQLIFLAPAESH